jgi:hypothetical protein
MALVVTVPECDFCEFSEDIREMNSSSFKSVKFSLSSSPFSRLGGLDKKSGFECFGPGI